MSCNGRAAATLAMLVAMLLVSSCSNDDVRPTEPADVVLEMIETTMVGLSDEVTMRRELVRLYAPDAILFIPSVSQAPVARGRDVVVNQLIARQVLTGTDFAGAGGINIEADGATVRWERTYSLVSGEVCRSVGNEAEVEDGLITKHVVGEPSCGEA